MNIENQESGARSQEPGVKSQKSVTASLPFLSSSALHALIAAGMFIGLAMFYRSTSMTLKVLGIALFCALAFLRPGLALAFVPLTAPLYLIPVWLTTIRENLRLPLHEIVLWVAMVAIAVQRGWQWVRARSQESGVRSQESRTSSATLPVLGSWFLVFEYLPYALFLLAGALGVAIAVERGAAFREFRWMVVEPMIFYALLRWGNDQRPTTNDQRLATTNVAAPAHPLMWVVNGFIIGGAVVGLLGILQYYGYDLVPTIFLHQKQVFISSDTVAADGLLRVTSVYGHPNNVGLYLGRVWPLAAALALYGFWRVSAVASSFSTRVRSVLFALCAVLCLLGIIVSFSRGAWFGIGAALVVLTFGWLRVLRVSRQQMILALACVAVVVVALVGWSLSLRSETGAGSANARVLIWREALALIRRHPLGLGLDQFYYYHNPFYGRSLIDPSLRGTSEETAAHPHNLLLDTWLSVGPLGLFALGWLVVRAFKRARVALSLPPSLPAALLVGAAAALVAALVHGGVDNFYFHVPDLSFAFWLLVGMIELAAQAPHDDTMTR